jgi:hypothetical protein
VEEKVLKLTRHQRRVNQRRVAALLRRNGRPLGRAPSKTGQPKHFVEWYRIAAEVRAVEAAKAGLS